MRHLLALFAILFSLTLLACDRDVVGPGGVTRLQLSESLDTLMIGDSASLTVSAFKDDGTRVNSVVAWSSSDPSVATVDAAGTIVALRTGTTLISALVGPVATRFSLQVIPFRNVTSCTGTGITHTSSLSPTTWRRLHNPHRITGTVVRDSIVIEPGVVVCADPDAQLVLRVLIAHGTADRPIKFLSADGVSRWRGITVRPPDGAGTGRPSRGHISQVFIELGDVSGVDIRTSHIRQGNAFGVSLHESTVDTGNVALAGGSFFENTIVRGGSLRIGYSRNAFANQGPITINGGRIEDSPGEATEIGSFNSPGFHDLNVINTIRIVGSRGGIGNMPAALFMKLWPTREAQENLLGNLDPTIRLWGTSSGPQVDVDHLYMRRDLRFAVYGYLGALAAGSVTIERGTTIAALGDLWVRGPLTLVGTDSARVVVTTPSTGCGNGATVCGFVLVDTVTSDLSYMTFDNAYLNVTEAHRVTARNIDFLRTRARAGLYVRAPGFRLSDCTIADHAGNGVEVHAGDDIHINDCNIERNGGLGVDNRTTTVIDAQRNWWGDPAGPFGPAGDGVSNNVDYSNHRTARR